MGTEIKQYPEIVTKIHEEFNIASEKLLLEAENILEDTRKEKLDKLINLGFINSKELTDSKVLLQREAELRILAGVIHKYKLTFENWKYISYKDIVRINNKYKLSIGSIEDYKGFVPLKNIQDVEEFFTKNPSLSKYAQRIEHIEFRNESFDSSGIKKIKNFLKKDNIVRHINYSRSSSTKDQLKSYLSEIGVHKWESSEYRTSITDVKFEEVTKLLICAPKNEMKVKTLKEKLALMTTFSYNPDPIILYPIDKEGCLIVTAWGDEASDPLILNEKLN